MALAQVHESDEEDEYHSLSGREPDVDEDGDQEAEDRLDQPPMHPLPAMQGAFDESILESTEEDVVRGPSVNGNAEARRQRLLEASQYDDSWTTRWKQRPSAQHHPLLKLMAQIIFGMHLIQQQAAKSNEEVVKILQTHVNEVDSFLERTSEDFDLAITDIDERIQHLKLPMSHLDTFTVMLDNKKFRMQLIEGNERIDKIIERTAKAMNAALMDVQRGLQATRDLGGYLDNVRDSWPRERQDLVDVYGAMRGNEQGWHKYLNDLQAKGNSLGNHLIQLGTLIGEMSKLAAAASRKNRPRSRPISPAYPAPTSPGLRSKFSKDAATSTPMGRPSISDILNKPLPREPDAVGGAAQATMPRTHSVPLLQHNEPPRAISRSSPSRNPAALPIAPDRSPQRPKTAGHAPRDPRPSRDDMTDFADFLRHSEPLRSNPPDPAMRQVSSEKKLTRSQSHGTHEILNVMVASSHGSDRGQSFVTRSKSHTSTAMLDRPRTSGNTLEKTSSIRPNSKSSEKALAVGPGKPAPRARKDSAASTAFARRISKRLKHIPPPDEGPLAQHQRSHDAMDWNQQQETTAASPPADSAYASEPEKPAPLRLRTNTSRPTTSHNGPPPEVPVRSPQRPSTGLGLFPRSGEPLTPSAASAAWNQASLQATPEQRTGLPSVGASAAPITTPGKASRMSSVRNIFHRKRG